MTECEPAFNLCESVKSVATIVISSVKICEICGYFRSAAAAGIRLGGAVLRVQSPPSLF